MFYSLQGEGARAGSANIFVRLQGCSAQHACATIGIRCDTEFESGRAWDLQEIKEWCVSRAPACRWIIFTGGEPLDQLTAEHLAWFRDQGFSLALETSGARPFPSALREYFDWIVCSPKVAEHILVRHFAEPNVRDSNVVHVHELRYVRHATQDIPQPKLQALEYFLSPHSDGADLNAANLRHCIALCQEHPRWRLSIQQHKVWRVL
jgi:organic radical activating enzyme